MAIKVSQHLSAQVLLVLKIAAGITLIMLLLLGVDHKELLALFLNSSPLWVMISVLAGFASFAYGALILKNIATPHAILPFWRLVKLGLIGKFFSLFLPSSVGGDIIKAIYLYPNFKTKADAFSVLAVQRVIGGLASIVVAIVAAVIYLPENFAAGILIAVGSAICLTGIAIVFLWTLRLTWPSVILKLLAKLATSKMGSFLIYVVKGIFYYRTKSVVLVRGLILALAASIIPVVMYLLAAEALQIQLTFPQALVAGTAAMVAIVVPVSPGGVGVREGAFVVVAILMGVSKEHAVAVAFFCRGVDLLYCLAGGLFYLNVSVSAKND